MTPVEHRSVAGLHLAGKTLDVGAYDVNGSVRGLFADYTGVDMREGPNVDVVANAHALPFDDAAFDNVLGLSLLEHDDEPARSVAEMRRVLRPGGALVLTAPTVGFPQHEHPSDYWRFLPAGLQVLARDMVVTRCGSIGKQLAMVVARKATLPLIAVGHTRAKTERLLQGLRQMGAFPAVTVWNGPGEYAGAIKTPNDGWDIGMYHAGLLAAPALQWAVFINDDCRWFGPEWMASALAAMREGRPWASMIGKARSKTPHLRTHCFGAPVADFLRLHQAAYEAKGLNGRGKARIFERSTAELFPAAVAARHPRESVVDRNCAGHGFMRGVAAAGMVDVEALENAPVAAPAEGPVDAVFVLGRGSQHGNLELRYALRSLERFCPWVRKVWVVGEDPGFLSPAVGFIPAPDCCSHFKDASIIGKLVEAAKHPEVAERFLCCSDDQYVTQPCAWEDFRPRWLRIWSESDAQWYERSGWHRNLRDTLRLFGEGARYFEPHIWAPMEKSKLLDMAEKRAWRDSKACVVFSLYYNHVREPGMDGKGGDHLYVHGAEQATAARHIAYADQAFNSPQFRAALERLFPAPSRFESGPAAGAAPVSAPVASPVKKPRTNDEIIADVLAQLRRGGHEELRRRAEEAEKLRAGNRQAGLLAWRPVVDDFIRATRGGSAVPLRAPCKSCAEKRAALQPPGRGHAAAPGLADAGGMNCRDCARKHLRKARVLIGEGIADARYVLETEHGLGELACAEDHLWFFDAPRAHQVRALRLGLEIPESPLSGMAGLAELDRIILGLALERGRR